jgi:hypothetical protein
MGSTNPDWKTNFKYYSIEKQTFHICVAQSQHCNSIAEGKLEGDG